MIADRLENIGNYGWMGEEFETAFRWLRETDLQALTPGTIQIDGDRIYAMLADNLLNRETPSFECHRLYADIQLVLSGRERFLLGWGERNTREEAGKDVRFCDAEETLSFTLGPGQFAVFMPEELHAPGNPDGEPSVCRKLVVKVRVH